MSNLKISTSTLFCRAPQTFISPSNVQCRYNKIQSPYNVVIFFLLRSNHGFWMFLLKDVLLVIRENFQKSKKKKKSCQYIMQWSPPLREDIRRNLKPTRTPLKVKQEGLF